MMKKLLSVIITAVMVISALPVTVFASDVSVIEPEDYFKETVRSREGAYTTYVLNDEGQDVELETAAASGTAVGDIPAAYDSRDYGRVTSVKDQNPLGSCWSFAFCAAAESSLISQGYASSDIDLSEAHLLWFRTANYVEGSDIPVQQDKINTIKNTFDDGGNDFDAMATAARWSGFTTEEKFPYIRSTDTTGMQFDEEDMFDSEYSLVSARKLTKNNTNEVKQSIMQYGAVTAQIYYTKDALNYLDNGECNHYQKKQSGSNHAVTVVGWDDNYDAGKFIIKPASGNGAWLIKNSWGDDTNDAGYFWLSYYDRSVGNFMEVVAKPAGEYDNNYQYDGVTCTAAIAFQRKAYGANVFTAKGYEKIGGCGFYTYSSSAINVTLSLYTGLSNESNPKSGTLCESKTVSVNKEGYFTVDFNGEYDVEPGEKFSIVALYSSSTGTAMIPYESRTTFDYTYGTQAGQSFYSSDGSAWTDVAETTNRGNIPLKVFTKDSEGAEAVSMTFTSIPQTVCNEGDFVDLSGVGVEVEYADGRTALIGRELLHINPVDTTTAGKKTVTVYYKNIGIDINITVTGPEEETVEEEPGEKVYITELRIVRMPYKTEYCTGEEIDTLGLILEAEYSNGSTGIINSGYKLSTDTAKGSGSKKITVSYEGVKVSFNIEVTFDAGRILREFIHNLLYFWIQH